MAYVYNTDIWGQCVLVVMQIQFCGACYTIMYANTTTWGHPVMVGMYTQLCGDSVQWHACINNYIGTVCKGLHACQIMYGQSLIICINA